MRKTGTFIEFQVNLKGLVHPEQIQNPEVLKMSMTGDSEAVLNQIRDIQGKDIPLEEKNSLINKILGKR